MTSPATIKESPIAKGEIVADGPVDRDAEVMRDFRLQMPVMRGVIRRRVLVNFRVDPVVIRRQLPERFRPKLHGGFAIAGICLIRLEAMRPKGAPGFVGLSSENAAHRVAVEWTGDWLEPREGVFILRRDTSSRLNHLVGGRIFPGEHHLADFDVADDGKRVEIAMRSRDGAVLVRVRGAESEAWPAGSCFGSLEESSRFFEAGSIGYSVTRDAGRLDGLRLETRNWVVRPFAVDVVESSYFDGVTLFPKGSVEFDHALIMREIEHEWHAVRGMGCEC